MTTIRGQASIAGAFEHPQRVIPDRTVAQVHAEVAVGARADAGLSMSDVDAYFCAGDAPGFGGFSMAESLGLELRHIDTTETGGSSYLCHVGHAAAAIATGKCSVALVTLGGLPRSDPASMMGGARAMFASARGRLRDGVRHGDPRRRRAGRPPAHVRVRHDERAAGRDQGGGIPPRPVQPRRLEGRFADQVWPEDTVVTRMWRDGDGAIVEASSQKGNVVLSQARAIVR